MLKPALVFIPGLLCDHRTWHTIINHYQHDYPCFVAMWENGDTLRSFIDRTLSLFNGPYILVGHSMGGRLALLTVLDSPDRIVGLCCVNSSADIDTPEKKQSRIDMIESIKTKNDQDLISKFAEKSTLTRSNYVVTMMLENTNRLVSQQSFLIDQPLRLNQLHGIQCPCLIIHSSNDKIKDVSQSVRIYDELPNSRLKLIDESGHMTPIEQPQRLILELDKWIKEEEFYEITRN